jgi:hypothetical protein
MLSCDLVRRGDATPNLRIEGAIPTLAGTTGGCLSFPEQVLLIRPTALGGSFARNIGARVWTGQQPQTCGFSSPDGPHPTVPSREATTLQPATLSIVGTALPAVRCLGAPTALAAPRGPRPAPRRATTRSRSSSPARHRPCHATGLPAVGRRRWRRCWRPSRSSRRVQRSARPSVAATGTVSAPRPQSAPDDGWARSGAPHSGSPLRPGWASGPRRTS